jgi:hypothetical protein
VLINPYNKIDYDNFTRQPEAVDDSYVQNADTFAEELNILIIQGIVFGCNHIVSLNARSVVSNIPAII